MQFRPRFDQPALPSWQVSCKQLDGVDPVNSDVVLIVRVEMWRVMRLPNLHEHANDDAEKPTDLWHIAFYRRNLWATGFLPTNGLATSCSRVVLDCPTADNTLITCISRAIVGAESVTQQDRAPRETDRSSTRQAIQARKKSTLTRKSSGFPVMTQTAARRRATGLRGLARSSSR